MKVAILGTGQLARMLALDAHRLGIETVVIGPEANPCAADVTRHQQVSLDDAAAVLAACRHAEVVTYELEHLSCDTVKLLEESLPVRPNARSLERSQDRLFEKEMFQALGMETAPFWRVDNREDLTQAIEAWGLPVLLKTRRDGFDGRGQRWIRQADDVPGEEHALRNTLAEAPVSFSRELSVVAVRGLDGSFDSYPLAENRHHENILIETRAPAKDLALRDQALSMARRVAEHLDYVGVFALELFEVEGRLLVNEMAPRVHNSGHWTLDGAVTSQFENHMRAVCGLPLGSCAARGVTVMRNLIGELPTTEALLQAPGSRLHLYGKAPRPKRKLGHVSTVYGSQAEADAASHE